MLRTLLTWLLASVASLAAVDRVTMLPSRVEGTTLAGDGRYLVLKLASDVYVYDVYEEKICRVITMGHSDFVFTAGGTTLLIADRQVNVLQTWNLLTGERLHAKANPALPVLLAVKMGRANPDLALVCSSNGQDAPDALGWSLLNTHNLEIVPCSIAEFANSAQVSRTFWHRRGDALQMHINCDPDLSTICLWNLSGGWPQGTTVFRRNQTSCELVDCHLSGAITVGDDGLLYSSTGQIYTREMKSMVSVDGAYLVPGQASAFFLAIARDGRVALHQAGEATALVPMERLPLRNFMQDSTPFVSFDQSLYLDPSRSTVLMIPPEKNCIIQRRYDLKAILASTGVDYLLVTSTAPKTAQIGKLLSYQVQASCSSTEPIMYTLEHAPMGMHISQLGLLEWPDPRSATGRENVVVLLKDQGGEQAYQRFELCLTQSESITAP